MFWSLKIIVLALLKFIVHTSVRDWFICLLIELNFVVHVFRKFLACYVCKCHKSSVLWISQIITTTLTLHTDLVQEFAHVAWIMGLVLSLSLRYWDVCVYMAWRSVNEHTAVSYDDREKADQAVPDLLEGSGCINPCISQIFCITLGLVYLREGLYCPLSQIWVFYIFTLCRNLVGKSLLWTSLTSPFLL
jgi:hypothetical protein